MKDIVNQDVSESILINLAFLWFPSILAVLISDSQTPDVIIMVTGILDIEANLLSVQCEEAIFQDHCMSCPFRSSSQAHVLNFMESVYILERESSTLILDYCAGYLLFVARIYVVEL